LLPPDVLTVPVATLDAAYAIADVESAFIRAAQEKEKISRAQWAAARAEFMPRVDARGTAAVGTQTPYTDLYRTNRLQGEVVVTMPLLDGGARLARTAGSREANQADWLLIDSAMRETRTAIASAWFQLAASRAALGYYQEATQSAMKALEGAQLQRRAGDRTTLDVLDLARDLLIQQTSYNTALAGEYLERANLLYAMGRMEAPQLTREVTALDPAIHYQRANRIASYLTVPGLRMLDGLILHPAPGDRAIRDPALTNTIALPLSPSQSSSDKTN
jgi:outer membrane protein TolC